MEEDQGKNVAKSPGVFPSKSAVYAKVAMHTDKILRTLIELLDSRTESIKLGAANKLIDKILPDLRATELTGEDNGPLRILVSLNEDDRRRLADHKLPEAAIDI